MGGPWARCYATWIQQIGGWASAKLLLNVYGHFIPTETEGYADNLASPDGPYAAPSLVCRCTPFRRSQVYGATEMPSTSSSGWQDGQGREEEDAE